MRRARERGVALSACCWTAFAVLAALDLFAIAEGHASWRTFTKPPLALLLAGALVARRAPLDRPRRWIVVALACSSVGDAVLLSASDTAFVFGTVAFAFAHLAFIIAFASVGGGLGFVRRKPLVAVPYVAVWSASAIVLAPHMGTLAFVALPYGFLVMLMALAALNLIGRLPLRSARLAAAGAVLFMISDGTIAEARFAPSLAPPHADLAIMALYLAAQTLTTVAFSG